MRRRIWQCIFVSLSIGGLCGVLLVGSSYGKTSFVPERYPLHIGSKVGLVGIILFGACFALLTHELGHVVAGWMVGFQFQFLAIGPFQVVRGESGRIRLEFNRDPTLFGGAALSLPTDFHDLVTRFAWVVAGGPLMSLALAVAGLAGYALTPGEIGLLPRFALAFSGFCCGVIGLGTAIPMPLNRAMILDGARLLRLLRGGALAARDAALVNLYGLVAAHQPARDWGDGIIATALVPAMTPRSNARLDSSPTRRRLTEVIARRAYEHLTRTLELRHTFAESWGPLLLAEAAYFEGWWRGRTRRGGGSANCQPVRPCYRSMSDRGLRRRQMRRLVRSLRLAPESRRHCGWHHSMLSGHATV